MDLARVYVEAAAKARDNFMQVPGHAISLCMALAATNKEREHIYGTMMLHSSM